MEQLHLIKTLQELQQLQEFIKDKDFIAFDTETTGLDKESEIIGFSVSADVDTGYYIVLASWNVKEQHLDYLETTGGAKALLQTLTGKNLIMHNAVFDCTRANSRYQIDLMPSVHTDTMILAHLLDENRHNGLKELAVSLFGEDSKQEQDEMKASVHANGGMLTRDNYELYKADCDLIGRYGAKDTILTLKLFYHLVPELYEQGLEDFFYKDESMPLLRGPTYDMNTTGLKVDADKLQKLKGELEADCMDAKAFIHKEIEAHVKDKYPGDKKTNVFNIGSSKQLAWLLFFKLGNDFHLLTDAGKEVCQGLGLKLPYTPAARREFIHIVTASKGRVYAPAVKNLKTGKEGRPKKVSDPWNYIACGKETLERYAHKYKWVTRFLEYAKNLKLLNTYVEGIQSRMKYNTIRPSFLQHGTTSGRYSSRNPNFQSLPRDDKRIKACIVARPSNVFVGADYSQLEPRVFASFSKDERLLACFKNGDDFYSVIGSTVFDKQGYSMKKDEPGSFAQTFKSLRDVSKVVALSATYGTTAPQMAPKIKKTLQEAQEVIDDYFERFPSVLELMKESHEQAKTHGEVKNLFGRPRRMPKAKDIVKIYGNRQHSDLPYEARNLLNLAVNHRIQSTGASIMNRAAISVWKTCQELGKSDPIWLKVRIVMQIHDEVILEGPQELQDEMVLVLKDAMEHSIELPGVDLIADPKIANNIADLK